jgi:hypothetical protein
MQNNQHPQYLTANGYRREKRNPSMRLKLEEARRKVRATRKKKELELLRRVNGVKTVSPVRKSRGISPEAAKMIAQAISGMMH